MIQVTPAIAIDENEIHLSFTRASGPGGQNVNKVSTVAQLHFDVENSPNLTPAVKSRLTKLAGHHMTKEGTLVIDARQYRSQVENREDAVNRLLEFIRKASVAPKRRVKTKATLGSKRRNSASKKIHSATKSARRAKITPDDE
jgi:ribosome-associated protein